MIRNYLVIALRLLVKNKIFSLINILGLSTGIACCILITLYVQEEFNYEKGFKDTERIYRINTTWTKDGNEESSGRTSPPIAIELAQNLPEIETATRMAQPLGVEQHIVRYKDKTFFERKAFLVDSTFLDVFSYKLLEGNPATALDGPATALISRSLSEKIFGDESPLDELLIINSGTSADTFRITGVVAQGNFPSQADADIYMCMNSNGWGRWILAQTTWANNNLLSGFLKLKKGVDFKSLEPKMAAMLEAKAGEELRQSGRKKTLWLQELENMHLYSDFSSSGFGVGGDIVYVYIIGSIGGLILLLACINFMNLTTAKAAQRSGEVGIRKSMGAYRGNLIRQFLGEAMIIVMFSLALSFLLVAVSLPLFNTIMQKQLSFNEQNIFFIVVASVIITLLTGLLAGSYPAFFLSSLKPSQVLKGKTLSSDGSQWLRKSLVVFQFVITITLISSIVIIQKQLNYIQNRSMGFDTEQVVMIPLRTQQASTQYNSLKTAFQGLPGVNHVSATTSLPSTPLFRDWLVYKQGWTNDQSVKHDIVSVDENYFDVLNVPLISGRDFLPDQDNLAGDTINNTRVIVNESSLRVFDIPLEDALGQSVYFEAGGERYEFEVIGVVKDFHQFSLHREIGPMIFMLPGNRNGFPYIAASVLIDSHSDAFESMRRVWSDQISDVPFETVFIHDNIRNLYASEQRTSTMLTISTTIALVISCLGLYGLSVYVAERKTKEIGIRKVVGASVESIIGMLSKEYIVLVGISFLISVPLGYYGMDRWLQGFAYKIDPGISVFVISGLISFVIAWFTVSFESFRAAHRNPVDTLRSS